MRDREQSMKSAFIGAFLASMLLAGVFLMGRSFGRLEMATDILKMVADATAKAKEPK